MSRFPEMVVMWCVYVLGISGVNIANAIEGKGTVELGFLVSWWFILLLLIVTIALDFISVWFEKVIE